MENADLNYLCTIIGNLSGVPVRRYEGEQLVFFHSFVSLPKDPVMLYWEEIQKLRAPIGYYVTDGFRYYGVISYEKKKIVIGPTCQTGSSDQELRELAFRLDVAPEEMEDFIIGMKSIIRMPLESIMQILCAMNYVLTGQKLSLQDIVVFDSQQELLNKESVADKVAQQYVEDAIPVQDVHNTFELERTIMTMVRKGGFCRLTGVDQVRSRCPWRNPCPGAAAADEKHLHCRGYTCFPGGHSRRYGCRGCLQSERCLYSKMRTVQSPGSDFESAIPHGFRVHPKGCQNPPREPTWETGCGCVQLRSASPVGSYHR